MNKLRRLVADWITKFVRTARLCSVQNKSDNKKKKLLGWERTHPQRAGRGAFKSLDVEIKLI